MVYLLCGRICGTAVVDTQYSEVHRNILYCSCSYATISSINRLFAQKRRSVVKARERTLNQHFSANAIGILHFHAFDGIRVKCGRRTNVANMIIN